MGCKVKLSPNVQAVVASAVAIRLIGIHIWAGLLPKIVFRERGGTPREDVLEE